MKNINDLVLEFFFYPASGHGSIRSTVTRIKPQDTYDQRYHTTGTAGQIHDYVDNKILSTHPSSFLSRVSKTFGSDHISGHGEVRAPISNASKHISSGIDKMRQLTGK